MRVVEYSRWVELVDVWRHAMRKDMWRVVVVVFISMSRLHFHVCKSIYAMEMGESNLQGLLRCRLAQVNPQRGGY